MTRWKRNTLLSVSAWKILGEPNGRSETLYTLRVRKSGGKNTKNTFPAQGGWSENRFDVKSSPLSSAFSVEERLNGLVTPRRKEWSRQPQSCLSAIRLTGLGSQSKKRPCPALARNVNTVCACCVSMCVRACNHVCIATHPRRERASLSSSVPDSRFTVHVTRRVLSSASCPHGRVDYNSVRLWNALDRGRLILKN